MLYHKVNRSDKKHKRREWWGKAVSCMLQLGWTKLGYLNKVPLRNNSEENDFPFFKLLRSLDMFSSPYFFLYKIALTKDFLVWDYVKIRSPPYFPKALLNDSTKCVTRGHEEKTNIRPTMSRNLTR